MARRRIASVLGGRVLVWGHYDETRPVGEDTIGTGRNRITTPVYEYDSFQVEHVDDFPLRMSVLERAWEESRATAIRELQDPKPTTLSARIDLAFGRVFPKGSLGVPTLRTNTLSQASVTSLNTAAFDVDAGDLIIVCGSIVNTADPGTVTVTDDSGHTWTPRQQAVQADSAISTRVFCATAYATDADNIVVTIDPTGTGIRWNIHVYTIPGADSTTPVVQSKLSQGNETSPSVTLDSTTDVKMVFGFIGVRNDSDGVTFGTDFTELTDSVSGGTSPAAGQAQYDIDPVDGTSDWSGVAATSSVRIALGIKEADAGGSVELVVADVAVGIAADSPALTQKNLLTVADATVAVTAESPALTQKNLLAVADATVGVSFDSPALVQKAILAVADALVAIGAESPALTQKNLLAVQDMAVAVLMDNVTLNLSTLLAVADVAVGVTIDGVALTQDYVLAVQDALVGITADSPGLIQANVLAVGDMLVAVTVDNVVLVIAASTFIDILSSRSRPFYRVDETSRVFYEAEGRSRPFYGVTEN